MGENLNRKDKAKKGRKKIIPVIVVIAVVVSAFFILNLSNDEPVVIGENGISIYLHQDGVYYIIARIRGGYEVRFEDITNIELLPYSARQLNERVDNLTVPRGRLYATAGREPITIVARYDDGNYHRLHVSLFPDASPTIWITRYEGVPVLLSFRYGHETEALYEQIVEAWEQWQAS